MNCRHCKSPLSLTFLDLGFAPPSNAYLSPLDLHAPEVYFPLKLRVCDRCWLVQTEDYPRSDQLFKSDYAYFSSVTRSLLEHAARYVEMITQRLALNDRSFVIEVASNDGYLLKNFVQAGIPCLGIEPTASTASAAEQIGVPVLREFFGEQVGKRLPAEKKQADLIIANNVVAHVPDVNDFTAGLQAALKPSGVITLEFQYVLRLIEFSQFDTVYHEHFSYLSLFSVKNILARAGLRVFDVEELPTQGGSLRVYGCHADDARLTEPAVDALLQMEREFGLQSIEPYLTFQQKADAAKDGLLMFLLEQKRAGKNVAAYGAAAKGNTLLNYAGVKPDLLPFVCDAAPSKQGKFLPGSHIPVLPPEEIARRDVDFLLILPWNIADEIMDHYKHVAGYRGRFVTAIPQLAIR